MFRPEIAAVEVVPDGPADERAIADTGPAELMDWLIQCVAVHVRRDPDDVAPDVPLAEYGLDSVTALSISTEIEERYGFELDPNALWEYPSLDALVPMLLAQLRPLDWTA